jgi:hypothetical protein
MAYEHMSTNEVVKAHGRLTYWQALNHAEFMIWMAARIARSYGVLQSHTANERRRYLTSARAWLEYASGERTGLNEARRNARR